MVTGLRFSYDCRYLLTVSGDACIFIWRLAPSLTKAMQNRLMEMQHPAAALTSASASSSASSSQQQQQSQLLMTPSRRPAAGASGAAAASPALSEVCVQPHMDVASSMASHKSKLCKAFNFM